MKYMLKTEIVVAVAISSMAALLIASGAGRAYGVGSSAGPPSSVEESVRGALENVRGRYRSKLSRYGLTESYFDETSGICDLMLLDVPTWTKYQIVYYRATGQIEWPRMMPKAVAEDLM